jgi:hypothetical protein
MLRSIAGVAAGYLIFALSAVLLFQVSGQDPKSFPELWFLVGSTLYGIVFAMLGGFVAAAIASRRPALHAIIVAALIGALALVSLIASLGRGSVWSEIAVLFFMTPAAAIGGFIRDRRRRRRAN